MFYDQVTCHNLSTSNESYNALSSVTGEESLAPTVHGPMTGFPVGKLSPRLTALL